MYKKGAYINGRYHLIQIFKTNTKILIYAFDAESPDTYSLSLENDQAKRIMEDREDYEILVKKL